MNTSVLNRKRQFKDHHQLRQASDTDENKLEKRELKKTMRKTKETLKKKERIKNLDALRELTDAALPQARAL